MTKSMRHEGRVCGRLCVPMKFQNPLANPSAAIGHCAMIRTPRTKTPLGFETRVL